MDLIEHYQVKPSYTLCQKTLFLVSVNPYCSTKTTMFILELNNKHKNKFVILNEKEFQKVFDPYKYIT